MLNHGSLGRWLTAAAVLAAAALPATAMADSIVYVKDGNVWLTEPDGSRQLQVTSDGGWTGASQSENGVIVGAKNRRLYRLARAGGVQNEIVTAMQSLNWNGPYDIDVSPDGTRVAYGYLYQHIVTDPTCPGTPSQCSSSSVFSGVAYSNTDGPASGVPSHTGWSYPAWVGDDLLLHSYADGFLNKETILRPFGSSNSDGDQWFTHPAIPRMYDATVRDGTLAFVGPDNGQLLSVLHVNGAPSATATTDDCFAYGQPTGKFASPTLAPGTRAMAWAENDGIWRGDFENPSDGCDGAPQIGHMIVPGGKSPDWGPADVPPAPDPGTKDPVPGPGPGPQQPPPTQASVELTVTKATIARALSKGLVVRVTGASGTVRLSARISAGTAKRAKLGRKARTVASGAGAAHDGAATVRLRFSRSTAKALRRLKTVPLTIRVTGGSATAAVTLRR